MFRLSVDIRFRHESGFAIDAKFDAGDGVTALVGPSGSGKSTLLHLIAGMLRPEDGFIQLGARTLVDTKAGISLVPEKRLVGIVFQDHLLFPHMTVRKNLRFGIGRHGCRSIAFDKVIDILEIGDLLDRAPATLSGGQRQRVAVARALLHGPDLLLLDEPLAALDEALKDRVLDYLKRTFEEWRIPTLFVCHDKQDVDRIADHVICINSGRIIRQIPTRAQGA